MTEDMLWFQVLGAVLIGLLLGVITRVLDWPPVATGFITVGAYIGLWYVVGWTMVGGPESFSQLVGGSLLVLPGFIGFFGVPLGGMFALSYWLMPGPRVER